jgi:hypothetical protein
MRFNYKNIFYLTILLILSGCNGGAEKKSLDSSTVAKRTFPQPTDSLANGLHPLYPTEENIVGKWILPHPMDTSANQHESYMEFLADKSVQVAEYPYLKPVKWQLNENKLILVHESLDPKEPGALINDTMVIEAVSDTTLHFYHINEPNFLMYLVKKK